MIEANPTSTPVSAQQWREIVGRHISPAIEPTWRRRHRRYPVHGDLVAHYCTTDGKPGRRTGWITQVAIKSISARLRETIPTGCPLTLHIDLSDDHLVVHGWARNCIQTIGGYRVGIELQFLS